MNTINMCALVCIIATFVAESPGTVSPSPSLCQGSRKLRPPSGLLGSLVVVVGVVVVGVVAFVVVLLATSVVVSFVWFTEIMLVVVTNEFSATKAGC